jgi:hypothetical protein
VVGLFTIGGHLMAVFVSIIVVNIGWSGNASPGRWAATPPVTLLSASDPVLVEGQELGACRHQMGR